MPESKIGKADKQRIQVSKQAGKLVASDPTAPVALEAELAGAGFSASQRAALLKILAVLRGS